MFEEFAKYILFVYVIFKNIRLQDALVVNTKSIPHFDAEFQASCCHSDRERVRHPGCTQLSIVIVFNCVIFGL